MIGIQFVLSIIYMLNINTDAACDCDGDSVNGSVVGEYDYNSVISHSYVGIHNNSEGMSNVDHKGENNVTH